jgi:hypothetical protein
MTERERLILEKMPQLVEAGARVVWEKRHGQALDHVVMQDPEGNEFCLA